MIVIASLQAIAAAMVVWFYLRMGVADARCRGANGENVADFNWSLFSLWVVVLVVSLLHVVLLVFYG
jgi:hypothetical protein